MDIKSVSIIFLGVTLLYAGVLSLSEDWYAGVGMMIGGSTLIVIPLWKAFVPSRNPSSGSTKYAAVKTGKQKKKKKRHLKVVKREEEEPPTYH